MEIDPFTWHFCHFSYLAVLQKSMALPKGITAQPSRFAALNLDSESESDGSGDEWLVVSGNKGTNKTKSNVGAPAQQKDDPAGARPLSKSAKKRARKKRNQQNLSEVSVKCHKVGNYSYMSCGVFVDAFTCSPKMPEKNKQGMK